MGYGGSEWLCQQDHLRASLCGLRCLLHAPPDALTPWSFRTVAQAWYVWGTSLTKKLGLSLENMGDNLKNYVACILKLVNQDLCRLHLSLTHPAPPSRAVITVSASFCPAFNKPDADRASSYVF